MKTREQIKAKVCKEFERSVSGDSGSSSHGSELGVTPPSKKQRMKF